MEFTISLSTIIAICKTITVVAGAWKIVSAPKKEEDSIIIKEDLNDKKDFRTIIF